jgi:hypothetical protein
VHLLASISIKRDGFIGSFIFEDLFYGHLPRTLSPTTSMPRYDDMEVRKKYMRCLKRKASITSLVPSEGIKLNKI